ncbi:aldo-keto reductase family 1 member B1-like [Panonychus citri]|uniref:aldo-keto reductase family 1 member B1-like n=1 Tax=Panonychus citri TaxID=50023 RepID=UPI0023079B44|nr:aldo-keto reductase family 1 member B1-like [Panonychus citri]
MAKPAISTSISFNNGLKVPLFGLGTWKSKPGEVKEAVKHALLEAGYRHIDCALVYQNEDEVGQALKEVFDSGALKREDVFITSKCWNTFHSRAKVMEAVKKTLTSLGLEYLDLYLVHSSMGFREGDELFPKNEAGKMIYSDIDIVETWQGMEDVHKAGLAKSIGVSNFNSEQIAKILANCTIKPVNNQVEVHPYLSQVELVEFCKKHDITVTAYSPLGSPDRPWAKPEDPSLFEEPEIKKIAEAHNKTPAQVLLRFGVQRNLITIPKSVTPARIAENIQVFDFELSEDEMKTIYSFNKNWRACGREADVDHPLYPFKIPF